MRKHDVESLNLGGRPTIGPKVEARLTPQVVSQIDGLAVKQGATRAEMLRKLIHYGLGDGPLLSELASMHDVETLDWTSTDDTIGAQVLSDGHRYWVAEMADNVVACTDDSDLAAAIYGATLVRYETITTDDTLGDGGSDTAYPELVDAGRTILNDLATQASRLREGAARLR